MIGTFVNTLYFAARFNARDQWHKAALEAEAILLPTQLVTTESVLIETLNFFANFPIEMKTVVTNAIEQFSVNKSIEILPHIDTIFSSGLKLYRARLDKGYSLTDCISMNAMRERGITEILTHDIISNKKVL